VTQTTAVAAGAVAAGAVVVAPASGGGSLPIAAAAGLTAAAAGAVNLAAGLAHDITYATGLSKQGGVVTGVVDTVKEFAHSKLLDKRTEAQKLMDSLPDKAPKDASPEMVAMINQKNIAMNIQKEINNSRIADPNFGYNEIAIVVPMVDGEKTPELQAAYDKEMKN
jgi:hypothetical protein